MISHDAENLRTVSFFNVSLTRQSLKYFLINSVRIEKGYSFFCLLNHSFNHYKSVLVLSE